MNDTHVTLTGWLGSGVTLRQAGGVPVAGFRLATTPRRYDRKLEQWVDGDTQWYSVSAWRQLGENCVVSLHSGDPVVLHGRLTTRSWTTETGEQRLSLEVDATFIGHDLRMGVTRFSRSPKAEDASQSGGGAGAQADAGTGEVGPSGDPLGADQERLAREESQGAGAAA